MLKEPADDRKIIWVYETIGGVGKTAFGKHVKSIFRTVYLRGVSSSANAAHLLSKTRDPDVVVIDLTRDDQSSFPWGIIE